MMLFRRFGLYALPLTFLMVGIVGACNRKDRSQGSDVPTVAPASEEASVCRCEGNTPAFRAVLGGVPVVICGALSAQMEHRWQATNYRLFDCTGSGTMMDECEQCSALIEHTGDTLVVTQYLHLPAGPSWQSVPVRQSVSRFFPYQGGLTVKRAKSMLDLPTPDAGAAARFLEGLRARRGKGEGSYGDWGEVIQRLLYLSLANDKTAQVLLRTFPEYFGFTPQQELDASYRSAVATLRLHKE